MEHNATNMSLPSFAFNQASYNSMDNYHGAFFESTKSYQVMHKLMGTHIILLAPVVATSL